MATRKKRRKGPMKWKAKSLVAATDSHVFLRDTPVVTAERSLLSRTFRDCNLVVSDNAFGEANSEICQSYAKRDAKGTVLPTSCTNPPAENHNFAYRQ